MSANAVAFINDRKKGQTCSHNLRVVWWAWWLNCIWCSKSQRLIKKASPSRISHLPMDFHVTAQISFIVESFPTLRTVSRKLFCAAMDWHVVFVVAKLGKLFIALAALIFLLYRKSFLNLTGNFNHYLAFIASTLLITYFDWFTSIKQTWKCRGWQNRLFGFITRIYFTFTITWIACVYFWFGMQFVTLIASVSGMRWRRCRGWIKAVKDGSWIFWNDTLTI